jgi:hypothetical protein
MTVPQAAVVANGTMKVRPRGVEPLGRLPPPDEYEPF